MLPAPCKWIDTEAGSYLNWHHGCIAYVALQPSPHHALRWWGLFCVVTVVTYNRRDRGGAELSARIRQTCE